jgi:TolB protein
MKSHVRRGGRKATMNAVRLARLSITVALVSLVGACSRRKPPNARALFVIDADGSGVRQLTPWDLGGGDHPVWSPNGKLILFRTVSGPDDMYGNLYTIHPDGSGLHELTDYDPGTIVLSYSFSPDGRWITFAKSGVGDEPDIFIMRLDGTDLGAVTQTELADSAPDWGSA